MSRSVPSPLHLAAPAAERARIEASAERLRRARFGERLWKRDPALWNTDAETHRTITARLGWLGLAAAMRPRLREFTAFAARLRSAGFTDALLLGMGGSSLAPEVLASVFGTSGRGVRLHVLDSTAPQAVRAAEAELDPARTLVLVSSKSGTTTETLDLFEYFFERFGRDGARFAAITDPGTPLAELARSRRLRAVFLAPPDVGGRYSALSPFGLVPAALLGLDIGRLLRAAAQAERIWRARPHDPGSPVRLGAALGALAEAGRDKLTLLLAAPLAPLGAWIEQLVAESSGKAGLGIVPIADESLGRPEAYGGDRVFVAVSTARRAACPQRTLRALARAGHPVLHWRVPQPYALGAELLRWEIAVAAACAVLGVNAFDEPNVAEAKETTRALLARLRGSERPQEPPLLAEADGLALLGDAAYRADTPRGCLRAFFERIRPGDYFALLLYGAPSPRAMAVAARIRARVRDRLGSATTAGFGPRYLHSTGQLHKGGPNTGVFLQVTAASSTDLAVPNRFYTFGELHRAQALGDLQVLARRGRRVLRVHLRGDLGSGLARLAAEIDAALEGVSRMR